MQQAAARACLFVSVCTMNDDKFSQTLIPKISFWGPGHHCRVLVADCWYYIIGPGQYVLVQIIHHIHVPPVDPVQPKVTMLFFTMLSWSCQLSNVSINTVYKFQEFRCQRFKKIKIKNLPPPADRLCSKNNNKMFSLQWKIAK